MKKRMFSIITALALCLSLGPAWALAAEGEGGPPADAVAKVEKTGQEAAYVDESGFADVFAFNSGNGGATVTLLRDVTLDKRLDIYISCTLDLGGRTLTTTVSSGTGITVYGPYYGVTSVTIKGGSIWADTDEDYAAVSTVGALTLENVTVTNLGGTGVSVTGAGAALTLTGTTAVTGRCGVMIGGSTSLTAGSGVTLEGTSAESPNAALWAGASGVTLNLSPGCTLWGPVAVSTDNPYSDTKRYVKGLLKGERCFLSGGKPVALGEDQQTLPGPVAVGTCTHDPSVCTYAPNEDAQTHTMTCRACGKTDTVNCSFSKYESISTTHHKMTCVCGREEKGAHMLDTKWIPEALSDTSTAIVYVCKSACGYSLQNGVIEHPAQQVQIVYGEAPELGIAATGGLGEVTITWKDEKGSEVSTDNPYRPEGLKTGDTHFLYEVTWGSGASWSSKVFVKVTPAPLSGTPTFGSGQGKALQDVEVTRPESWGEGGTFTWVDEDPAQQVVQGKSYHYVFFSEDGNHYSEGTAVLWAAPSSGGSGGGR